MHKSEMTEYCSALLPIQGGWRNWLCVKLYFTNNFMQGRLIELDYMYSNSLCFEG